MRLGHSGNSSTITGNLLDPLERNEKNIITLMASSQALQFSYVRECATMFGMYLYAWAKVGTVSEFGRYWSLNSPEHLNIVGSDTLVYDSSSHLVLSAHISITY